ncbi:MAG TPA: polymer-forming cytoskeletal protein [Rhodanobacteraceae bacterium]|nr:polymer-forming cytoskeletal protein [Rhodanobacteraceae bacterium]
MALWKDQVKPSSSSVADALDLSRFEAPPAEAAAVDAAPVQPAFRPARDKAQSESLISPDIAIEGKIEGAGHVRIAGSFKGDVNVRGDLTIEAGAKVTGSVRANKVTIAGELIGNIEGASHVELLQSGALTGDVKAETLTVAAGSRMRGQADFGWEDSQSSRKGEHNGAARNGSVHLAS